MIKKSLIFILIFMAGFLSCMLISLAYSETEKPLVIGSLSLVSGTAAPSNWIKESQIHIYENAVVIDIKGASLGRYAATGSMRPVLDKDSNGIKIVPENPDQINVGDIITFEQNDELIIHRVIQKGEDEEGAYFITKGDNNNVTDGKVRFQDIRYVIVAMIW